MSSRYNDDKRANKPVYAESSESARRVHDQRRRYMDTRAPNLGGTRCRAEEATQIACVVKRGETGEFGPRWIRTTASRWDLSRWAAPPE